MHVGNNLHWWSQQRSVSRYVRPHMNDPHFFPQNRLSYGVYVDQVWEGFLHLLDQCGCLIVFWVSGRHGLPPLTQLGIKVLCPRFLTDDDERDDKSTQDGIQLHFVWF